MLYTNAVFSRKENNFEPAKCEVKKVIRLTGTEYDSFARNMLRDQNFIKDNVDLMRFENGAQGCLLVVGEGRRDGILVDSSGSDYARYSSFIPNAESFLLMEQYPALAALNHRLMDIVNFIVEESCTAKTGNRTAIDLQELETMFGIDINRNNVLHGVILQMLETRPEIRDYELDKNELIIYGEPDAKAMDEDKGVAKRDTLSDPSVSMMDMYAYGYSWDGMTPLGKEAALELFDEGHIVFRLYPDDAEGAVDERADIETFDGLFGLEDAGWVEQIQAAPIEVFILNCERHANGENVGEWLALPSDAKTLHGLFERIGVDRSSDDAFSITAVRVRDDYIRDYVTKYNSIDELHMLASHMDCLYDFELETFKSILSSGVVNIGSGVGALINVLEANNFDGFRMIAANNYEELGRYLNEQDPDNYPDGVSHAEYGRQLAAAEKGKFTEAGYIYFCNKELSQEYNGIVSDEYAIVGEALCGLRPKTQERSGNEGNSSVLKKIREAKTAPRKPKDKDAQTNKKSKGGQEL